MSEYKQYSQIEHVLYRPGMYIGSVEEEMVETWVYENNNMIKKKIQINPGLYKIIDEIIVNALDQCTKLIHESSNYVVKKIQVEIKDDIISVYNSGLGIPIYLHQESNIFIPELIFGHLLTSSNYDDEKERMVGGQNGIGAKACNIFSTFFSIETIDIERNLYYYQEFSNNMSSKSNPIIKSSKVKYPYTKITFRPDYSRFKMTTLSKDMIQCIHKRTMDICALTPKNVSVFWNNEKINIQNFKQYISLYTHQPIYDYSDEYWDIICFESEGKFESISFVNGIYTWKGGKHVDYILNQLIKRISEYIYKKTKEEIKTSLIKDSLCVAVSVKIMNPKFDSQMKDTLTTSSSQWLSKPTIPDKWIPKLSFITYIIIRK